MQDALRDALRVERLGRLDVLLVRHAEPIPPGSPGWEERDDDRPLTAQGREAAEQLADELEPYVITSVYCSPYQRALETVTPTANRRMLEVQVLPDLRERRLGLPPGRTGRSSPMPTPTPTPTRTAPAACSCLERHHGVCYHLAAHKRSGSMRRTPRRRPSDNNQSSTCGRRPP